MIWSVYVAEQDRVERRAEKIGAWITTIAEAYAGTLSRPESKAAMPGFAPARWHSFVCGWCGGKDCDRCRNSRIEWATEFELHELITKQRGRIWVRVQDPYVHDVQIDSGYTLNESTGTRRARSLSNIDHEIEKLERDADIRAGLEVRETPELRSLRIVHAQLHVGGRDNKRNRIFLRRLDAALNLMRDRYPHLYGKVPVCRDSLKVLQALIPGSIPPV